MFSFDVFKFLREFFWNKLIKFWENSLIWFWNLFYCKEKKIFEIRKFLKRMNALLLIGSLCFMTSVHSLDCYSCQNCDEGNSQTTTCNADQDSCFVSVV